MKGIVNILLCLLLVGCTTTKKAIKTTSTTETNVHTDIAKQSHIDKGISSSSTLEDLSTVTDSTLTHMIVVKYSAPDSAGKQYPVERDSISQKSYLHKANRVAFAKKDTSVTHAITNTTEQSKTQINSSKNTTEKETVETTTPVWVKLIYLGLIVIGAIAAWFALQRFGIITLLSTLTKKLIAKIK